MARFFTNTGFFIFIWMLPLLLPDVSTSAYAQIRIPEFVAPAPDTYALAKYGDIPVSYYTGTPEIHIPLWTVTDGNITVPIALSYHASGIKVDEIASWVGLGWSLNAGGMITRIIRDAPDAPNLTGTGLNAKRTDSDFKWFDIFMSGYPMSVRNSEYYTLMGNVYGKGNGYDNAPDVFMFNFNGKSGKFYFDNNGIPRLFEHENLKITWSTPSSAPNNIKFIIKDEYGTSYEFDARETTSFNGLGQQATSWYLSKMTSTQGNIITFSYQLYSTVNYERLPRVAILNANSGSASFSGYSNIILPGLPNTELKLSQITTSNGTTVSFVPDLLKARLDYLSSGPTYPLKEIVIRNYSNSIERIFALNTGYFIANDQNLSYPGLNYRLKLNGITEYSGDRTQSKPIGNFSYFGDGTSETTLRLPYRLSPSQDHWGYYNGQPNTHLFPGKNSGINVFQDPVYELRMGGGGIFFSGSITGGANREPDTQRKKACMLKKITYPTGGYSEFDYESHGYNGQSVAGLRVLKIITKESTTSVSMESDYSYEGACLAVSFDANSYFTLFHVDPQTFFNGNYGPNLVNALYDFSSDNTINVGNLNGNYIRVVANPQAVLDGADGSLGYEKVTVRQPGNGKTVYSYAAPGQFTSQYNDFKAREDGQPITDWYKVQTFFPCVNDLCCYLVTTGLYSTKDWPNLPVYSNEWKRSVLKSKEIYTEGGTIPVNKQTFEYYMENTGNVAGYHISRIGLPGAGDVIVYEYFVAKYYLPYNRVALKQKSVQDISSTGTITQITKYTYNSDVYRLLNREVTYNSFGDSTEIVYKYPSDLNGSVYDLMEAINMVDFPVEQTGKINGKVTGSKLVLYKSENSMYVPDKEYRPETTSPLPSFTYFNGTTKDSRYGTTPEISYSVHDSKGNLLEISNKEGITNSFIWSYNNTYPVAKLVNISQSAIPSSAKTAIQGHSFTNSSVLSNIQADVSYLKSQLSALMSNPGYMITFYTYKSLVGMTSQTGPDGVTNYYIYDNFGRLSEVRNDDGMLLKKYDYHYAGL